MPAQSDSHPATWTTWTNAQLDAARLEGDPEVDGLAQGIIHDIPFDRNTGRLGYHQLPGVADVLL